MKKLSLALMFAFAATFGQAQIVPQGMNYQAVARNLSGEVIANQPVSLKIELYKGPQDSPEVFYSETHSVRTNQLGLFTLIIGAGTPVNGTFAKVPWSTEEIWVSISIKDKSASDFAVISSSKLLAVPYAFHAGTAAELVNKQPGTASRTNGTTDSLNTGVWKTSGNLGHTIEDRLGSVDSTDLVMITNDRERFKITADGKIVLGSLAGRTTAEAKHVMTNAAGELFVQENTDSSETKIMAGENIEVSGKGTSESPYIVKANMDSLPVSPLDKVIASGNETTGGIVFKHDDTFIETRPSNYDVSAKRGSFSMAVKEFPGVNGAGNRSNVVGSFWGYNTGPGGGQVIPGEAAYRFAGETFYDVGGQKMMEFHLPEMHTNSGLGIRPFSMYIDRETGIGSANYQMHQFNFKKVNDANIDWMRMRNDAGNIRIEMQPEAGGTSYFEMNGSGPDGSGGYSSSRAFLLNGGNGLAFVTSKAGFSFNSYMEVQGNISVKGITAVSSDPSPNAIAHSFQGNKLNNRLFIVGDDAYSEKFYITPTSVMSSLDFLSLGNFNVGKAIIPAGGTDLNLKFNTHGNNGKINFISDAGGILAGQMTKDGLFAKSIQTEKPDAAQSAAKLKIGNVVTATIKDITAKYLQIEIDGISYKIPLMD